MKIASINKSSSHKAYRGLIIPPAIRDFLTGRIWIKDHTPFSQSLIEHLIQRNIIEVTPGIAEKPTLKCNRCHNTKHHFFATFECAKCQKICVYCRHCIQMGRISNCTMLITWNGTTKPHTKTHSFHWQSTFTPLQQQAANEMKASIQQKKSHLLHAVCGAGKTEILFQAVHQALLQENRVCVATPRTDVVLELAPRFQQVFPQTTIHVLYGNAPKQTGYAQLIIATTHQLYRFQNAFDVMIVDEADAFPYTFDESLQTAVIKAKKANAPILFVTATPSTKLLLQSRKENWGYSFIPQRFHGHPLPIPRIQALWRYNQSILKERIPKKLLDWTLTRIQNKEPFLIFFPTIELLEKAAPLFQQLHEGILAVHAEDQERKNKVLQLRNEQIPGLLTTTILERGITIKNVQVAVVGAESPIFTASALIQISGRVGRNAQYPAGDIVFFHHGITAEMDMAIAEIKRLNLESTQK